MAELTAVADEPTRQLVLDDGPRRPKRRLVVAISAGVAVAFVAVAAGLAAGSDDGEPTVVGMTPTTASAQPPPSVTVTTAPAGEPGGPATGPATTAPTSSPTTAAPGLGTGTAPDRSRPPGVTYRPEAVWPETLAELDRLQASVDQGHQPWRNDPVEVARAYLADRGLPAPGLAAFRATGARAGSVDCTVAGKGGRVDLQRLLNGTIWFVAGSRSATFPGVDIDRQGGSIAVTVQAGVEGAMTARAKRPGGSWGEAQRAQASAGATRTFTLAPGGSGADVIVQLRMEGDARAGLAEIYLGEGTEGARYSAVDSESRLTVEGLGPVRIGMSLKEARAVSGLPMTPTESEHCVSYQTDGPPSGLFFTSTNGGQTLDLITVSGPSITTLSGIRVGSTLAEVRRAYGDKLRGSVQDGWGKLVYRPDDPALGQLGLALLFSEGKVNGMWVGLRSVVQADEVCA